VPRPQGRPRSSRGISAILESKPARLLDPSGKRCVPLRHGLRVTCFPPSRDWACARPTPFEAGHGESHCRLDSGSLGQIGRCRSR